MSSKNTALTEAKIHFSRWVRLAESGQEVVIARRGKPVVKLVPLTPKPHDSSLARKAAIAALLSFEPIVVPHAWFTALRQAGRE
jgi:prevent-host-death family protein